MIEGGAEFVAIFRGEANERLDAIAVALRAISLGVADEAAVETLYRESHTIKGGAGMFGLDDARTLAQAMEDALEPARESGVLAPGLIDPLLRAADALRRTINAP
jgi:two-component system chemotaxis sensor kinase CheA